MGLEKSFYSIHHPRRLPQPNWAQSTELGFKMSAHGPFPSNKLPRAVPKRLMNRINSSPFQCPVWSFGKRYSTHTSYDAPSCFLKAITCFRKQVKYFQVPFGGSIKLNRHKYVNMFQMPQKILYSIKNFFLYHVKYQMEG